MWGGETNSGTSPGCPWSPPGTGTLCWASPAVHPLHPDPSWPLCAPAPTSGITQTIPGRAWWSLELSSALIHDLILRRVIAQSAVLLLAAKCRREMGLCSLIVAVPQSEAWHWHLQPRNVTLIRLGSCSGLLIVEHEPCAFRPSWLQIGVPGQVRRGAVPLPELWSGIRRDHVGNFSDRPQREVWEGSTWSKPHP